VIQTDPTIDNITDRNKEAPIIIPKDLVVLIIILKLNECFGYSLIGITRARI